MSQAGSQTSERITDPSLKDNGEIIFDNEVSLDVCTSESDETEVLAVRVKIVKIEENGQLEQVRIELSSDDDLFFVYESVFTATDFESLQEKQDLTIEFDEFPSVLVDMLSPDEEKTEEFIVKFISDSDTHGILNFQQKLRFKSVDIFAIEFETASDEFIKDHIHYRFNALKTELLAARTELKDVYALLKIKNPSVLKKVSDKRAKVKEETTKPK